MSHPTETGFRAVWASLLVLALLPAQSHADEPTDAGAAIERADAGAPAPPVSAGEQLYRDGVALRDAGDVDGACAKFYAAMRFSPSPDAMLAEARCRLRHDDLTGAVGLLARAREAAAGDALRALRGEIEREIRSIMKRSVRLVIVTGEVEDGAWVEYRIDDRSLDGDPSGQTLRVSAGKHEVRAIRPGCAQWSKRFDGAAGDRIEIAVPALGCEQLAGSDTGPTLATRRAARYRRRHDQSAAGNSYTRAAAWVGGVAAMSFLVAIGRSTSDSDDAHSQVVTAGVIGGLTTAVAISLYVYGNRQKKAAPERATEVSVAPIVEDGATGFVFGVRGAF